jgi:threonine dehydrogenase-like Zn-dependent dehydrogenase
MWAYKLIRPYTFETVNVPEPGETALADGDVVLRVLAGSICGSDVPSVRGGVNPEHPDKGALAAGLVGYPMHEVVGEVVRSRSDLQVGERVVGWVTGSFGLAEFVVTQGASLLPVDARPDPLMQTMIQPLACVLHAVDRMPDPAGTAAAVIGLGPLGILFCHALHDRGAVVTGVDPVDRSDVAQRFGIDDLASTMSDRWARSLGDTGRPGLVVEAVGYHAATINNAISAVARDGAIFHFGGTQETAYSLNIRTFQRKNLTLIAGFTPVPLRRKVLDQAREYLDRYPGLAEAYLTDVFDAGDIEAAYRRASVPAAGRLKVGLRWN